MTTNSCVFDTSALLALLRAEPGAERVRSRLELADCCMHIVNVGEFLFTASRKMPDRFTPESAAVWLETTFLSQSRVMTTSFLILAARIRRATPALSFGDGVAIALGATLNVPVLTTEKAFVKAADFARIELIR